MEEKERLTREWGDQLLEETQAQSPDARSCVDIILIDYHDDRQRLVSRKPQQTVAIIHSANFLKGFKLKIPKSILLSELKEIQILFETWIC